MRRVLSLYVCLLVALCAVGQTLLTGKIVDAADKEPLPGVSVVVKDSLNKICGFTASDSEGRFQIAPKPNVSTIEFSLVGYSKLTMPLHKYQNKSVLSLTASAEQLKDVNISARQIKEQGDTITYFVSTFAKEQDKTIGEVLKRMPGIKVEESGKIQYQGSDINRFYIEGADMLGGRYGVATNGISASDIGAVEVLEDHQPLQVLGGIVYSDQAALNLKLKEGSKATWLVNGSVGAGYSENPAKGLWEGELFAMAAMPGFQTLATFKTNNTGHDIAPEISDFVYSDRKTDMQAYYTTGNASSAMFGNSRERFNTSHLLSVNQLWKLSNEYQVKAQADYVYNREHNHSEKITGYFENDTIVTIRDRLSGYNRENILNGQLTITTNKRNFYLNNTLKSEIQWNKGNYTNSGSSRNIQNVDNSDFFVENSFTLISRFKKNRLIRIESLTQWESMPQKLAIEKEAGFGQRLRNHTFYNEEKSSYRFNAYKWRFNVEGGVRLYFSSLNSFTDNLPEGSFSTNRNYVSVYANAEIERVFSRVELIASIPASFTHYSLGQILGHRNNASLSPTLRLRWNPHHNLTLGLSGSLSRTPPSMMSFYPGVIAADYNIFNGGLYFFKLSTGRRLTANVRFRDTSIGLFANAMAMMSWNRTPYTRSRLIENGNIVYGYADNSSDNRMLNIMCDMSKTVRPIKGGVSLNCFFSKIWRKLLSQSQLTGSSNDNLTVKAKAYSSPCKFLYLQYECRFNYSAIHNLQTDRTADIVNSGLITVYPCPKIYIDFMGDWCQSGIFNSRRKDIAVVDTRLTFKLGKNIELKASVTNILNKNSYSTSSYGLLNSTTSTSYMRGREWMISIYLKK